VIAAYHPDGQGTLVPEIPGRGPCSDWDERVCRLASDHDRERKTGPGFSIRVMRCRVHRHGFTLYPPGQVPYGRKRLAAMAFDGTLEQCEEADSDEGGRESRARVERFRGTYFEAAVEAAQGKAWPGTGCEGSLQERFPTQMRQLKRAVRLLGAAPELESRERERIAMLLGVPGQTLEDAARGLTDRAGYRKLGRAAVAVLAALPEDSSLFERLAESGFPVGFWPQPRICPGPGRPLRRSCVAPSTGRRGPSFRLSGTRPPPQRP